KKRAQPLPWATTRSVDAVPGSQNGVLEAVVAALRVAAAITTAGDGSANVRDRISAGGIEAGRHRPIP
ncbi:hypothetical protein ACX9NE_29130, partial [Mycobacterium sp. ML4]